jgi:ubiquitin C-terminal hydrolase
VNDNNDHNNYINSILQCFINIKDLIEFFLSKKNDIKNYKLSNAFLEILKDKEKKNINNFEKIIFEMNPSFKNIENNDPKDLVLFLIENMHKELNPVMNVYKYSDNSINMYNIDRCFQSYENYFQKNFRSIFSNIFYGRYDNQTQFIYKANTVSHSIQYFNILVFSLDEVKNYYPKYCKNEINITNCFEYYQRNIKDQNDEKIIKNKIILYAPKVLIISLNYNKLQKKTKFILNNKINLQSFIYYKNNRFIYELIGIVTNIMNSESKKHFIAFCKSYEDYYWYKYDNNSIAIPSSFEEAKKLGEYDILFYSKI